MKIRAVRYIIILQLNDNYNDLCGSLRPPLFRIIFKHFSKNRRRLKNIRGTTCCKGGPYVAAIIGPGEPPTATKIAVDGPGDHL